MSARKDYIAFIKENGLVLDKDQMMHDQHKVNTSLDPDNISKTKKTPNKNFIKTAIQQFNELASSGSQTVDENGNVTHSRGAISTLPNNTALAYLINAPYFKGAYVDVEESQDNKFYTKDTTDRPSLVDKPGHKHAIFYHAPAIRAMIYAASHGQALTALEGIDDGDYKLSGLHYKYSYPQYQNLLENTKQFSKPHNGLTLGFSGEEKDGKIITNSIAERQSNKLFYKQVSEHLSAALYKHEIETPKRLAKLGKLTSINSKTKSTTPITISKADTKTGLDITFANVPSILANAFKKQMKFEQAQAEENELGKAIDYGADIFSKNRQKDIKKYAKEDLNYNYNSKQKNITLSLSHGYQKHADHYIKLLSPAINGFNQAQKQKALAKNKQHKPLPEADLSQIKGSTQDQMQL